MDREATTPPPSRRVKSRRKPGGNFTEDESAVIWHEYKTAKATGRRGDVKALAAKWGCNRSTIRDIVRRRDDRGTFKRMPAPGRPTVMTPRKVARLRNELERNHYDVPFRRLAEVVGASKATVHQYMVKNDYAMRRSRFVPGLSSVQLKKRRDFAKKHRRNRWVGHVDVDEKYFKKTTRSSLKVPPDVDARAVTRIPVHHKSHLPQVMFLTAIARPDDRCNGLLSLERVAEVYTAQRSSKNHKRGDQYLKDCTMTQARFLRMMKQVVGQIRRKMKRHKFVTVQMDNATPHKVLDALERHVSRTHMPHFPRISFMFQPAQSPDMNANNLGFYKSFDAVVQRELGPRVSADAVAAAVRRAWKVYDTDNLTAIFDTKERVMSLVLSSGGRNDYELHARKQR